MSLHSVSSEPTPRLSPSLQIATRIREIMAARQITGTSAARAIGLDQNAFSRRYRGVNPFSIDELALLSTFLQVPFNVLTAHEMYDDEADGATQR